jgi:lysophospholipase L1-like esterase
VPEPLPLPLPDSAAEITRYVAIGDSFSEGVGDEGDVRLPGWAGRLATGLAARTTGEVFYANLAIRGRLLAGALETQLPAALALEPAPTLVTFCAGGNDMLRPRFDIPGLLAQVEAAAERVAGVGARLVLLSPADPSARLPLGRLVRSRGIAWAEALGEYAAGAGIPFVDVSLDPYLHHAEFWSDDRLHMNALGHQRVADLALQAIADAPEPVSPTVSTATRRRLADELGYYRRHVAPWVKRRLTGTSTGDGRAAPFADWVRVDRSTS